jgi:hypothetical protein
MTTATKVLALLAGLTAVAVLVPMAVVTVATATGQARPRA